MGLVLTAALCVGCYFGFWDTRDSGSFSLHQKLEGEVSGAMAAMQGHPLLGSIFMTGKISFKDLFMVNLDIDRDGMEEVYLLVNHPSACDPQGCLFFIFENRSGRDWSLVERSRRPVIGTSQAGLFVPFGNDVMFLSTRYQFPPGENTIGGVPEDAWLNQNLPTEVVGYDLRLEDLWVGHYDIDDDGYAEVFAMVEPFDYCSREGCGGMIVTFDGLDEEGRERWRNIGWFRSIGGSSAMPGETPFFVTDTKIDGHRTLVSDYECLVWRGAAYESFLWEDIGGEGIGEGCVAPTEAQQSGAVQ